MKRRKILSITAAELEKLSTKQLLARLKQLHQCEQSLSLSDREEHEIHPEYIEFKDSDEWTTAYQQLKDILAKREHVPKGIELVKLRKEKALNQRTMDRMTRMYRRRSGPAGNT